MNPQYTSQTCNDCGHIAKENRQSQSKFVCTSCGMTSNADINASHQTKVAVVEVESNLFVGWGIKGLLSYFSNP